MSEKAISPKGRSWSEVREQILTPEERGASNLRVAMMVELAAARAEKEMCIRDRLFYSAALWFATQLG